MSKAEIILAERDGKTARVGYRVLTDELDDNGGPVYREGLLEVPDDGQGDKELAARLVAAVVEAETPKADPRKPKPRPVEGLPAAVDLEEAPGPAVK